MDRVLLTSMSTIWLQEPNMGICLRMTVHCLLPPDKTGFSGEGAKWSANIHTHIQRERVNEWMNECLMTPQHKKQISYWVSEKGKRMK